MDKKNNLVSLASAAVVLAIALLLGLYYRSEVLENTRLAEERNGTFARVLANSVWPEFGAALTHTAGVEPARLAQREVTRKVQARLRELSTGVPILKVKIYDPNGLTVFSSVPAEIGQDRSANSGFLAARAGGVMSSLVHRGRMTVTDREILDVDVVETYIPVRADADAPVLAVFELYCDVTYALREVYSRSVRLLMVLAGVVVLLVLLFYVARVTRRGASEAKQQEPPCHCGVPGCPGRLLDARAEDRLAR
jgi:hypothetical protein